MSEQAPTPDCFLFHTPTRIVFGPGAAAKLAETLRGLGVTKPLAVGDPGLATMLWATVLDPLAEAGMTCSVFTGVEPNPSDRSVMQAVAQAKAEGCDGVVGLGGGSALDTAKAVSVLAVHPGGIYDYFGLDLVPGPGLPCVALPTTAGTGSEVTHWAVISDTRGKAPVKDAIGSRHCCPDVALADPLLTLGLPPMLTACTGMDALTHAIEAYTATLANPVSDGLALAAVAKISRNIVGATEQGDDEDARAGMLLGSLLAGVAFSNSDVAAVHCLGESLGGWFGLHHGHVMGLLLPLVMRANLGAAEERFADLARAMDACGLETPTHQAAESAVEAVAGLLRRLGIAPLGSLDVDPGLFPEIAELATRHACLPSNPRPLGKEDFLNILRQAYDDVLGLEKP